MIMEIQKKLDIETSSEELLCKMAIKKCLQEREPLINQLHNQYNNRKQTLKSINQIKTKMYKSIKIKN